MKLEDTIERIEAFRLLIDKFDGEIMKPPSEKVISKALDLAKQLRPIPEVFITGRGSIQLEWEKEELYLEMEIFEDHISIFNQMELGGKIVKLGED